MKKNIITLTAAVLALSPALQGCDSMLTSMTNTNFLERPFPTLGDIDATQQQMQREGFSLKLTRVVDKRRPHAFTDLPEEENIDQVDPDRLPGNATGYVRSVLRQYFPTPNNATSLLSEIDLRDLKLRVLTGNLLSGEFGRYIVSIEADVLVRDQAGRVIYRDTLTIEREARRVASAGRQPSTALDEKRMRILLEQVIQEVGLKMYRGTKANMGRGGGKNRDADISVPEHL
jgi:hypothetical protein